MVRPVFALIALVLILNPVTEGVFRLGQIPGKNPGSVVGVGNDRRIILRGLGAPIQTDQTVLAANLPKVFATVAMMGDLGEQALRAGPILDLAGVVAEDGYEVFGTGENKDVLGLPVPWHAFGGLTCNSGNAQVPAEAEWPVTVTRAVDEAEFRLEAVSARRQREGNRKVPCSRKEVRRKLLAYTLQGPSTFRNRDDLARIG